MPTTATNRLATPRHLPLPDLLGELRVDKGPKNLSFDALFLGSGRRAMEREQKLDKKR